MQESIGNRVPTMKVARALIINEHREILLARRKPNAKNNPGMLEFPGGQYEPGESFEQALRREIREETGLIVEPLIHREQIECSVLERRKGSPHSGFKLTLLSKAEIIDATDIHPQAEEVSELLWLYVPELVQVTDQLTAPTLYGLGFHSLQGYGIELPELAY